MLKIDAFAHITTEKYLARFRQLAPDIGSKTEQRRLAMVDYGIREKLMRRNPDVMQIVTMSNLPLERYVSAKEAVELAEIGNEELCELVKQNPELFYGAVGVIPTDDIEASVRIADYCMRDLHLLGVQLYSTIERTSYADPKYRPIFAKVAEYGRAVWVHPAGTNKDLGMFSWPYESSYFMFEMVKSGIFYEFPELKIIIHHAGGMAPFFRERAATLLPHMGFLHGDEHFRKFYADTALYGNTAGLMCAYDYFGAEHMLFGTDAPLGAPWGGNGATDNTLSAIEKMSVPEKEKEMILQGNAVKMFGIHL